VGPRRGRLPGGQLPDAVVGVEWPLPGHGPRLLARCRPHPGRLRLPADRQLRPLRQDRPPPVRQHQLRDRARRVHPHRPGLLRPQAQRGERRGQPGRHRRQPLVEQRRGRPERRPGGPDDPRAAPPRPDDHAAAQPGRAHDQARRRARPLPGRQQQRLLPGQRALLARLGAPGPGLPGLLRRSRRFPEPAPGLLAAPVLRGRAHLRRRAVRHLMVPAGRRGDDGRRLAGGLRQVARRLPERRRAARPGPARQAAPR
jgi:hypothetical protein